MFPFASCRSGVLVIWLGPSGRFSSVALVALFGGLTPRSCVRCLIARTLFPTNVVDFAVTVVAVMVVVYRCLLVANHSFYLSLS